MANLSITDNWFMTPKEFKKFLARDQHCLHCGGDGDDLVPQHRLGRGMGSKNSKAEQVANVIVLCSFANGLMESNAEFARRCRDYGWKLRSFQDPLETPVYDVIQGVWYKLDNTFGRVIVE